jgi:rod shape-determining protein MreC
MYEAFNTVVEYFSLGKTNKMLAEENARLRALLKESYLARNMDAYTVNDTLYEQQYRYIAAKVVSNSVNKRNNYLILNKGTRQGITREMAVITPEGIVGIVKEASGDFCSVLSVLNSQTHISAKIRKYNQNGTVVWDGPDQHYGTLKDIPGHVRIKIGDTVVTSGYSYIFPEGIVIGTIDDYKLIEGNNFYRIRVRFSVDYNRLSYVEVVTNLFKGEFDQIKGSSRNDD